MLIARDVKAIRRGTSHLQSIAHLRSNHLLCYSHFPRYQTARPPERIEVAEKSRYQLCNQCYMVPAHLNNETASLLKARRLPSCLVLQLTYKSQASFAKHFNSPDHCNYWMGSSAALWLVHASRLDRRGVGKGFKIKWIMAHLLFFPKAIILHYIDFPLFQQPTAMQNKHLPWWGCGRSFLVRVTWGCWMQYVSPALTLHGARILCRDKSALKCCF